MNASTDLAYEHERLRILAELMKLYGDAAREASERLDQAGIPLMNAQRVFKMASEDRQRALRVGFLHIHGLLII